MPFPREARHHLQEVQGEGGACQGDNAQPAPEQQLQPGAQQPRRQHRARGAAVHRGRDRGQCGRPARPSPTPQVKCAGAGRCSRPLGGPGAEEGARRAGSLPSSGRWRGWAPAWLPPWSSSRRRPAGLVTSRVKALVTRTGLCCASSGKRKSGKRLERSIGCAGVHGGALVGGDGRIMKVEWKEAAW